MSTDDTRDDLSQPTPPKPERTLAQKLVTIPKALAVTVIFFVIWLITNTNLPSCNSPQVIINGGSCVARQSYLHTWSGWLAILFLVVTVALIAIRYGVDLVKAAQRKA